MLLNIRALCLVIAALILSYSSLTLSQPQTLTISTLSHPIPVPTSDKQLLIYELHFFNPNSQPLRIGRIEVYDNTNKLLTTLAGNDLIKDSMVYQAGKPAFPTILELNKDMGAFVYMGISLDKSQPIPTQLSHKIWIVSTNSDKSRVNVEKVSYDLSVNQEKPPVLGPPLQGYNWVAESAISNTSIHRRTILPMDGEFYLAQRYAIDWVQICPDGREAHDNLHENQKWNAFGHKVLAVDNGVVTKMRDTIKKNNIPPGFPLPPLGPADAAGNFVIQSIKQNGKDYYVLYAHMQPGSIQVKEGDKVVKGQVIGLLGNTGNSSAPHLHLHVMDKNDPLKANGVPFVFENMTLQGNAGEIDEDYGIWMPPLNHSNFIKGVIPTENQIIRFSNDDNLMQCPR
ncbi:MAG: M23 family metallopeptidase [Gammaproteobacteria bacterium]|nr:M23 family metallopeptidase [Gammaproteobacteria bacterium]MCW5583334.1 M23 family metallopeptidase [Gammaproteobacteria bacterium]